MSQVVESHVSPLKFQKRSQHSDELCLITSRLSVILELFYTIIVLKLNMLLFVQFFNLI